MKAVEEWTLWADEKTVNLNRQRGVYPKIERDRGYNTKLFYCYYTQSDDDKSDGMLCIPMHLHFHDAYKKFSALILSM